MADTIILLTLELYIYYSLRGEDQNAVYEVLVFEQILSNLYFKSTSGGGVIHCDFWQCLRIPALAGVATVVRSYVQFQCLLTNIPSTSAENSHGIQVGLPGQLGVLRRGPSEQLILARGDAF
jgi:hypothetical protein